MWFTERIDSNISNFSKSTEHGRKVNTYHMSLLIF